MFPPYEYLCRLADHYPQAIGVYLMLWREQDDDGKLTYTKSIIRDGKYLSWAKFLNSLRDLATEGLLEYHIMGKNVQIIMAQYKFRENR